MKTWLYLTAEGLSTLSPEWPCCLWSSAGERQLQPLNQAAQTLQGRAVDLLLPMELCSWLRSEAWPSRRKPDARAIAFAVEEQLSEPLEKLHLSIGARDAQGRYPVLVIDRERFAAVLKLLQEAGINVRSVYVDADRLPHEQALGICWFGRWLLGGDLPARLALSEHSLALLKPVLPVDIQWQNSADADAWLDAASPRSINLLHGAFARQGRRLPWRLGAVSVFALLLLTWGASVARVEFLESQSRQLQSRSEQQFKALYPEQTRIVDLAAQLGALQNQDAQPQAGRIAELVKLVEQVIGATQVDIQRIEFRQGEGWKIPLIANSFAELEVLRERGRQQGTPVRIDGASKNGNRVQATLIVEQDT